MKRVERIRRLDDPQEREGKFKFQIYILQEQRSC